MESSRDLIGCEFLRELGIAIPLGARRVVPVLKALIEDADSGAPDSVRPALNEARAEIPELERRMRLVEHQLRALARQIPLVQMLRTVPGADLVRTTALVAFIGVAHEQGLLEEPRYELSGGWPVPDTCHQPAKIHAEQCEQACQYHGKMNLTAARMLSRRQARGREDPQEAIERRQCAEN